MRRAGYGAAIQGRLAFGERVPRLGAVPHASPREESVPLQARFRGFDLHAGVAVPAGRRDALERLIRYIARPPLSNDRLEILPDGRVALRLKRAFSDGSTHIVYSPEALIERLCALIPRPRTHRVRYHGVFASASPVRRLVTPPAESSPPQAPTARATEQGPRCAHQGQPSDRTRFRWILWATLLQRVFGVDSLTCPNCSGRMQVIAAILKAEVVVKILQSLGLPAEPPEIRRARPPPESGLIEYDLC